MIIQLLVKDSIPISPVINANPKGDSSLCAHMDGGSMVCTTDQLRLLWDYEELPVAPVRL